MALFAIGDTHLSIGGSKPMTVFTGWERYTERLEENWRRLVRLEDTVGIPGDISWGALSRHGRILHFCRPCRGASCC